MQLTNSEEQLMKYIWKLEKAFFKELKEEYPEPKPATTTINTFLKKLTKKGFVSYEMYGHSRQYYPLISKEQYFSKHMKGLLKNFFNNSIEQFGSFFTREIDISDEDLKKLRKIVDEKIKSKPND
jgi:predicted transcriptional regulator